MEKRRQNGGFRRKIVQDYLKSIDDDTKRLVCYLYMRNYKDGEIRKILHISKKRLGKIKDQIAFDLLKAGIRNQEN